MKYVDAEKLKSILKAKVEKRKKWMKTIDWSVWYDLNREDMCIFQIIDSLQQDHDFKEEKIIEILKSPQDIICEQFKSLSTEGKMKMLITLIKEYM